MSRRFKPFSPLAGEQQQASDPRDHAALSASAGTGKTHVLTARVLRLLLTGTDPGAILCLTFTKAGAAEMAERVHSRLAHWVRLKDVQLGRELFALGEPHDPAMIAKARTLFARVLDAPGGGLRIQTIHAFAQGLLAAFPAEAGIVPGFRPLDAREEDLLARQTLADMLVRAEASGDLSLIRDVQALSYRLGEGGAERLLMACARSNRAMQALGPREGIEPFVRREFGLPAGDIESFIAEQCCDDLFDMETLLKIDGANRAWGSKTGMDCCDVIAAWRGGDQSSRAMGLSDIANIVLKKDGEPRVVTAGLLKADPSYQEHAARLVECCSRLIEVRRTAALITDLAAGMRAGQAFALDYAARKRAVGALDFDDLIREAEALLTTAGMGDWVRYKLDQGIDHILIDEAQDTNAQQWRIVEAITEEFFAGAGASTTRRTIFTVGDYKQAIFGFQGTDPREFESARRYFEAKAKAVLAAADESDLPHSQTPPDFRDLSMDRSFRSSQPILDVVDRVIADLGHEAFDLPRAPNPHVANTRRPGSVTLWQPLASEAEPVDEEGGEENWVSDSVRRYATLLAKQIRHWIDHPFRLEVKDRALRPEDILILVRSRGTLASLVVARLHAENVPVAGVDRLSLTAPLAVQDLLAAARFAAQPLDDLNLANLLVSPLFDWTQDDLFDVAHRREGALWPRLRSGEVQLSRQGVLEQTLEFLHQILAMADFTTPHQFLERLLSGPLSGRRKLLERLGNEARDPIEELLASALEFETSSAPTLQTFLDWFSRGDVEIVRDPSAPLDAVRVMTVHGSKGLQAPIVILADACADPDRKRGQGSAKLSLPAVGTVPIFRPRKEELVEPVRTQIAARDALERYEHWRLLYVAMTRAEERLYIGGSLGPADRKGPPQSSWYKAVEASFGSLLAEAAEVPFWGQARRFGAGERPEKPATPVTATHEILPDWLNAAAPIEERPPRPIAPSSLGEDDVMDPPPSEAMRDAAVRGRLLHALFERLPGVTAETRADLGSRWLQHSAGIADPELRRALLRDACDIIEDPRHADLFSPSCLAEAPIAAVVGDGFVVSGTVDRLLVEDGRVMVADFKTSRQVPASLAQIPHAHLRQMAAYTEALKVIFPDVPVEAKLLYTSAPVLYDLPEQLLAAHSPTAGNG